MNKIEYKSGTFTEQRKFIGQEYDAASGLSYLNARYYDGKMGKFFSQDPVFWNNSQLAIQLVDPQSWNSYAYARNNPVLLSDPNGEFVPLLAAIAAAVVSGIFLNDIQPAQAPTSESLACTAPLQPMSFAELAIPGYENIPTSVRVSVSIGASILAKKPEGEIGKVVNNIADKTANFVSKYGSELGQRMNEASKIFSQEGINISEHGLYRTIQRESRGVTPEKIVDVMKSGEKYLDSKYNNISYFKDGLRVATDEKGGIKTVVTQKSIQPERFKPLNSN